ncbi:MAG: peptide ABC transporter substrate-binding protein [Candidatus Pacebacteria bacterium]|nr:peptide ABC transporter substrate-binding protein [Candidatus Paceibacterota bacterium]
MFKKQISIPVLKQAEASYKKMAPFERWAFYALVIALVASTLILTTRVYVYSTVLVPASGGTIIEGVVGAPRFINPVLAISQTDKDLSKLVYAGLMAMDSSGKLVPKLAASYTVSDDSKEYTFTLLDGLTFHDGTPLTAEDVVFTIEKAVQPDIKSPERVNWEGVKVTQDGYLTVIFTLSKPYSQFLQNTTLGILPEEHWNKLSADEFIFSNLNTSPIGSGPYKFINMSHDNSGIPSKIELVGFKDFVLGKPYIKNFVLKFYANRELVEEALKNRDVSSISEVSLRSVGDILLHRDYNITTSTLPRIFAVFFNQSHNSALESKKVRKALRGVIDTQLLVDEILDGYAQALNAPLLNTTEDLISHSLLNVQDARKLIEDAGWTLDEDTNIYTKDSEELLIVLTTANSTELKEVVDYVAQVWRAVGISVKLEVFEPGDIAQSVLRAREYDALLFGEILGVDPDLYAFWHSSQRNDPGLNIANYANSTVDKLLIQARKTIAPTERSKIYSEISDIINADIPAIFLYAPSFLYISDENILGINFPAAIEPHDRFSNVHKWHIKTNRSLKLLTHLTTDKQHDRYTR